MLSGVGPKEDLKRFDIPVLADLPVGLNLQDHPNLPMEYNSTIPSIRLEELEDKIELIKYFFTGDGYLASTMIQGSAFFHTKLNKNKFPDLQFHFIPIASNCDFYVRFLGTLPEFCRKEEANYWGFGFVIVLLHQKSRGNVKLASKNPKDDPIITLNFFSEEEDRSTMKEGIKLAEKFAKTKAMKDLHTGLKKE